MAASRDGEAAPSAAGIIAARSATRLPARTRRNGVRIRRHGSRSPIALLAVLAVGLAAGCGGDDGGSGDVAAVEAGVVALGTTQNVSCDELGSEEVGGVERMVFTCGFDEEI